MSYNMNCVKKKKKKGVTLYRNRKEKVTVGSDLDNLGQLQLGGEFCQSWEVFSVNQYVSHTHISGERSEPVNAPLLSLFSHLCILTNGSYRGKKKSSRGKTGRDRQPRSCLH